MSLNLLWKSNELRLMKVLPRWILRAISWVGSVRLIWGNANPYQKRSPISITMQAFEELLFIDMIYIGGFSMLWKLLSVQQDSVFPSLLFNPTFSWLLFKLLWVPFFWRGNSLSFSFPFCDLERPKLCVWQRARAILIAGSLFSPDGQSQRLGENGVGSPHFQCISRRHFRAQWYWLIQQSQYSRLFFLIPLGLLWAN